MSTAGVAAVRVAAAAAALVIVGLGSAMTAVAASGDSVTVDGSGSLTVRHIESLTVDASAPAYCELGLTQRHATLTMTGPSGADSSTQTLATSGATPCNQDIDLDATVATPGRNGAYAVEIDSHRHSATATIDVVVPPAPPSDVSATTNGTTASFAWTANSEPDVTGYQVTDGDGQVEKSTSASDACQNGRCSTSLAAGSGAAGTTEKFAVRALRCGVSCSKRVVGATSAVSVSFAAAGHAGSPTPQPTSSGHPVGHGGVPSAPTGNGGRASGGHAARSGARHGARSATHHRAVRSRRSRSPVATPSPAPSSRPSASSASRVSVAAPGGAGSLDLSPVLRGLAIAAVVLLIAVHLRVWASSDFS
jgi:hypothetical protein